MDLAKRDTPLRSQPQTTFRRETTMPRQATDLPGLEVNAPITRPDMSGAEKLSELLGLANNVGQKIFGDIQEGHNQADAAQAALDFGTNSKNEDKFSKSRAYRDAWQLQGAKKLAIDVSTEVTDKFNTALNDPDHPATIEDLDHIFEETVKGHLLDEHGQPLDFITPQAKMTLGNALATLKMKLMPDAAKAIKTQTDTKLFATTFHNMMFERGAGAPIGAAPLATPEVTPEVTFKPVPKGWKGNQEDAIQELGMTADEAKSFIKTGKDPRKAPMAPAQLDRVDLKARIAAAESGGSGDGAVNPLSTASGRYQITDATFKSLGGSMAKKNDPAEQERVMDKLLAKNEAALTKAGLSITPRNVYLAHFLGAAGAIQAMSKPEAPVAAAVQKANPFTRGWKNADVIAWAQRKMGGTAALSDGSGPDLQTAQAQAPTPRPGFDIEGFMHSLPPSVDKGEAKSWLIQSLFAEATSTGDTSLLNGLENSSRKDGTPSFTPDERIKIAETRTRLEDKNRVEADRAEKKLQEDNAGLVLQAFSEGNPPSRAWLNEQADKGLLDHRFVYTMIDHIESETKSDAREARAEARAAQAEEDNTLDTMVYSMEAARRAGILDGSSYAEDVKRFESGELGTGKKAAARLLRLQAATKTGQKMTEENPEFAYYSGKLKQDFKPRRMGDGQLLLLKTVAKVDEATYQAMVSFYEEKVHSGEKPGDAYREAVQKYGPKANAPQNELSNIRQQIEALKAKRAGR